MISAAEAWHCLSCGHWHKQQKCAAITHNETGGAHKCCCTGEPQQGVIRNQRDDVIPL